MLSAFSPLYLGLFRVHQAYLRSRRPSARPGIPLVVVGALRSGGSGKTSVALALARDLALRGLRPALLAYRLGPGDASGTDPIEVRPDSDWRVTSEEAVLLRRESGLRVFATRDRARAWERLAAQAVGATGEDAFDILISDDGFQDPRLEGAFRILLLAPGENPGLFDLLPGGAFRETASARARADLVLEGPWPAASSRPPDHPVTVTDRLPTRARFHRRLSLPAGLERGRSCIIHCALGDNAPFLADLERCGIAAAEIVAGRNHGPVPFARLRAAAARHPAAPILCTRKELVKLEGAPGLPTPLALEQETILDPEAADAVEAFRLLPGNGYLVHYPG